MLDEKGYRVKYDTTVTECLGSMLVFVVRTFTYMILIYKGPVSHWLVTNRDQTIYSQADRPSTIDLQF